MASETNYDVVGTYYRPIEILFSILGPMNNLVLSKIMWNCTKRDGVSKQSLEHMAEDLGTCAKTVQRSIKALLKDEFIEDVTPDGRPIKTPRWYRDTKKVQETCIILLQQKKDKQKIYGQNDHRFEDEENPIGQIDPSIGQKVLSYRTKSPQIQGIYGQKVLQEDSLDILKESLKEEKISKNFSSDSSPKPKKTEQSPDEIIVSQMRRDAKNRVIASIENTQLLNLINNVELFKAIKEEMDSTLLPEPKKKYKQAD